MDKVKEAIRPLLRFRHNKEQKVIIDPTANYDLEKELQSNIDNGNYQRRFGVAEIPYEFYTNLYVPLVRLTYYASTSASLFLPNGLFLCEATAKLHPDDKFCRLTGRQVAQQKLVDLLRSDYLCLKDDIKYNFLVRLTHNKTAQPINW